MTPLQYTLGCLLALFPGPPGILFEDSYIQLYPISPQKCLEYDLSKDVTFDLYTSHNPLAPSSLRIGDDRLLEMSHIDFSIPTVMYFHAFFESANATSGILIRQAHLLRGGFNVIMINARRLYAGPWYVNSVKNTWIVGLYAAKFIDYLYSRGLEPMMLHLIGLSLGAHTAGVAGRAAMMRPGRITGLDPALPLFDGVPKVYQLDKSDAHFVDIIHTDAGLFGISKMSGHVDFYVNGGVSPQPGCDLKTLLPNMNIVEKFFCSHWRSYLLYVQSVLNPHAFPGIRCGKGMLSCRMMKESKVIKNLVDVKYPDTYLGFAVNLRARGKYYVKTSAFPPYTLEKMKQHNFKIKVH